MEAGAGGEGAVEKVGKVEQEILGGGLEVDPDEFGGKAVQGVGGLCGTWGAGEHKGMVEGVD